MAGNTNNNNLINGAIQNRVTVYQDEADDVQNAINLLNSSQAQHLLDQAGGIQGGLHETSQPFVALEQLRQTILSQRTLLPQEQTRRTRFVDQNT